MAYFSLVLFVIDTVAMLIYIGFSTDSIFDILIHIWVIYYLVMGIITYLNMKKLPVDEMETVDEESAEDSMENDCDSVFLRRAATDVKSRIFIESEEAGLHIVFRRVKRTNELVVNGYVYDEYVALAEMAHTLSAKVSGHRIQVSFDGATTLYLFVDDQQVAKKRRFY